jgi:hypothetical protein
MVMKNGNCEFGSIDSKKDLLGYLKNPKKIPNKWFIGELNYT